jgi:hypothetical protein
MGDGVGTSEMDKWRALGGHKILVVIVLCREVKGEDGSYSCEKPGGYPAGEYNTFLRYMHEFLCHISYHTFV